MKLKAKIILPREHAANKPPSSPTIARGEEFETTKEKGEALVKAGKASEVHVTAPTKA